MQNENAVEKLAQQIESDAAAGEVKDLRALILRFPVIRQLYLAAAVRCLGARRFYFDKSAGEMVFEPDGTAQMRAAVFLASYDAGLPMQTTVNLNLGGDKGPTLEEAAAGSPALVDALERALEQAKKRAPKRIKQAVPGEV